MAETMETRNITVKIQAELHSRARTEQEAMGITLSQYMEKVLTEHFDYMERKEDKNMGPTRTLAFQVSEDLFQRVKDYLRKTHITQKEFVIGLIEDELERFEMSEREQNLEADQEDEEEEKSLNEDSQCAPENAQEDEMEEGQGGEEDPSENAAEGQENDEDGLAEDEEFLDADEQFEEDGMSMSM